MAEEKSPQLSDALKGKFEMKNGVQPGPAMVKLTHGYAEVDFRTMTVEQAQDLIQKGCKDIGEIKPSGAAKTSI